MPVHQVLDNLRMLAHVALAKLSYGVADHRHPSRKRALDVVRVARAKTPSPTTPLECVQIFQIVSALEKIPGDMAEVGVFRGTTAAVILAASSGKRLHLFDTFQGLPYGEGPVQQGEYSASLADVRNGLKEHLSRVEFHPGLFPHETAASVAANRFSFVNLDVDLHDVTLSALQVFWPRLSPGAVILSHDYPRLEGVVRAFEVFFSGQRASFFPLSGYQCMAVRLDDDSSNQAPGKT